MWGCKKLSRRLQQKVFKNLESVVYMDKEDATYSPIYDYLNYGMPTASDPDTIKKRGRIKQLIHEIEKNEQTF